MNFPAILTCLVLCIAVVVLGHFGWLPPSVVSHLIAVLGGSLLPTSALAARKPADPAAVRIATTLKPSAPADSDSGDISPLLKVEVKPVAGETEKS